MAKFPNWGVGTDVSAANLANDVPNIVVKASSSSVNNSTTLIDDGELVNIPLAVGKWWIRFVFFTVSPTTGCVLKTQWGFTGTWNNTLRFCKGPGSTNAAAPNVITPMTMSANATNGNAIYGLSNSSAYSVVEEEAYDVNVTVTGNLSLKFAQNAAVATTLFIQPGSAVALRQIG